MNFGKNGEVWNIWAWLVVNTSGLRGVCWRPIRGVQRWEIRRKRVGRLYQGGKTWKQHNTDGVEIWMMRPLKEYGGSKRAGFPDLLFSTVFRTLLLQLLIELLLTSSWKTKRADETCLLCAEGCIWQHPDIASFVPTIPKWIVNCVSVSQSQPVMRWDLVAPEDRFRISPAIQTQEKDGLGSWMCLRWSPWSWSMPFHSMSM